MPESDVISNEELEIKKQTFIESLQLSNDKYSKIEEDTRNQRDCQQWFSERRNRLTASNFGRICKMKKTTSCKNMVHNLLYGTQLQNIKQLEYGKNLN